MESGTSRTFSAALTGTQYVSGGGAVGVPLQRMDRASWAVVHPAATTTTYTVQVSNMNDQEARDSAAAGTAEDWHDDPEIAPVTVTGASAFSMAAIDSEFARCRLKAVTTAGNGVSTVRQQTKAP